MDPNTALINLRVAQATIARLEGQTPDDPDARARWGDQMRTAFSEAAGAADALDSWLSRGGFAPDEWGAAWRADLASAAAELAEWKPRKFVPIGNPTAVALVDPTAVTAVEVRQKTRHSNVGDLWLVIVYLSHGFVIVGEHEDSSDAYADRAVIADLIAGALIPPKLTDVLQIPEVE